MAAHSKETGPLVQFEINTAPGRLEALVPLRLVSEGNDTAHWRTKHARHKKQRHWLAYVLHDHGITLPATVSLTRLAPRTIDSDNLIFSCKFCRDAIASELCYDYRPGRADDTPLISWCYSQAKCDRYGLLLVISSHEASSTSPYQGLLPASNIALKVPQVLQTTPSAYAPGMPLTP